jgi:Phosphoglycerate dehydrogenase and related dehydrogenases
VQSIRKNSILGAGLDVLEFEKSSFENMFANTLTKDFEYLLKSEKVLLSPHVGGWTNESYYKLSTVLATKIIKQFT